MDVLIGWPGGDWQASARLAGTLVFGYLALIWLASLIWVYRDITSRTRDPISQLVGVGVAAVMPLLGLPIYFALRPSETLQQAFDRQIEQEAILADMSSVAACPSCRRPTEADFMVCAFCGTALKEPCASCREPLLHAWRYCPHCSTPRSGVRSSPRLDFTPEDEEDFALAGDTSRDPGAGSGEPGGARAQSRRRQFRGVTSNGQARTTEGQPGASPLRRQTSTTPRPAED